VLVCEVKRQLENQQPFVEAGAGFEGEQPVDKTVDGCEENPVSTSVMVVNLTTVERRALCLIASSAAAVILGVVLCAR